MICQEQKGVGHRSKLISSFLAGESLRKTASNDRISELFFRKEAIKQELRGGALRLREREFFGGQVALIGAKYYISWGK